jgi:hypothetical protein
MTIITITRPYQWTNQALSINVYIDDVLSGEVVVGETKDFEVKPGKHTVYVKNKWGGSLPVEVFVDRNETKALRLSSFKYLVLLSPLIISAVFIIYFSIKSLFNLEQDIMIDSLIMLLFFAIVFFGFAKNHYWRLEEVDINKDALNIEKAR